MPRTLGGTGVCAGTCLLAVPTQHTEVGVGWAWSRDVGSCGRSGSQGNALPRAGWPTMTCWCVGSTSASSLAAVFWPIASEMALLH